MIDAIPFAFTVAMRPPHNISPNASRKTPAWITGRERGTWRNAWYAAIITGLEDMQGTPGMVSMPTEPIIPGEAMCHITYYRDRSAKKWDGDNLLAVCKIGIDQLESTGIIGNDRDLAFAPIRQFEALRGSRARLEVHLVPTGTLADVHMDDRHDRALVVLRDLMNHVEMGQRTGVIDAASNWHVAYTQIVSRLHDDEPTPAERTQTPG